MNAIILTCLDCKATASERFDDVDIMRIIQQYSTCKCGSKRVVMRDMVEDGEAKPPEKPKRIVSQSMHKRDSIFTHRHYELLFKRLPRPEREIVGYRNRGLAFPAIAKKIGGKEHDVYRVYKKAVVRLYRILAAGDYEANG